VIINTSYQITRHVPESPGQLPRDGQRTRDVLPHQGIAAGVDNVLYAVAQEPYTGSISKSALARRSSRNEPLLAPGW
jgi:hypothetical protein